MNAPNFSSILDQPVTEIKRPPLLPAGPYICLVEGIPNFGESKVKRTPQVEFNLKPLQAMGDDLQAQIATLEKPLDYFKLRTTFYLTEDAVYRLDEFLFEHVGIEFGTSRKQAISMTPGKQVVAVVIHTPIGDGTRLIAQVNSTARV